MGYYEGPEDDDSLDELVLEPLEEKIRQSTLNEYNWDLKSVDKVFLNSPYRSKKIDVEMFEVSHDLIAECPVEVNVGKNLPQEILDILYNEEGSQEITGEYKYSPNYVITLNEYNQKTGILSGYCSLDVEGYGEDGDYDY